MSLSSDTESTIANYIDNIEYLLDEYHLHTKINEDLPYYKWIKYTDHLPLNEHRPILIYDSHYDNISEGISFVALQHGLYSKYMKYDKYLPSHWMRIKKPED